jgi:hypothetical protein
MDNENENENEVLARLRDAGLEAFFPALADLGCTTPESFGETSGSAFSCKQLEFRHNLNDVAVGLGMSNCQIKAFVGVAFDFADRNRNRRAAAWDPMMAGVLHGCESLNFWETFQRQGLTFEAITRMSEDDAVERFRMGLDEGENQQKYRVMVVYKRAIHVRDILAKEPQQKLIKS